MPDKRTLEAVRKDKRAGKSPGTQAGEFVKEEIRHIRGGKHGARSTEQAIAIALSKARRAGVKLPPPGPGTSAATKRQALRDREYALSGKHPSPARSRAMLKKLRTYGKKAASKKALAKHARSVAAHRRRAGSH